jgi:hypothetical protein
LDFNPILDCKLQTDTVISEQEIWASHPPVWISLEVMSGISAKLCLPGIQAEKSPAAVLQADEPETLSL